MAIGDGYGLGKGMTNLAERQQLRNKIDALVAHLCGLIRDEFDYIPIRDSERAVLLATADHAELLVKTAGRTLITS